MRLLLSLIFLLGTLTACIEEAESNSEPVAPVKETKTEAEIAPTALSITEKICQNQAFPGSKKLDSSAHRFGKACNLLELSGVRMENQVALYLCKSELLSPGFPNNEGLAPALVKETLGGHAEKADLLTNYGFAGKWFSLLIIKDSSDGSESIIATKADLKNVPLTLTSDEAALAWAYLSGSLGQGMGNQGFSAKALCGAVLEKYSDGWMLRNTDVFVNCAPRENRDIRISNHGQVDVVKKTSDPNAPVLCVD
ncbi:MAG: hypothetical protein P8P30_00490 [Rickettsiales bacterium]|nr:hypothetical protein [Rickettsiales bacterium]